MAEEDIIFGKNRHFFGGIEPSNMVAFEAYTEDGLVKINAQLPNDTIIDGQTLVSVAGAVIRRKDTNYPKDEFDGDLIAVINNSSTFVDSSADPASTYHYSAYPYSTQGVYNVSTINRTVVNEPENMVKFTAKSVYDSSAETATVQIEADLPDSVVGAVIRKSMAGYPVDETDGEEFMTITEDGIYMDSDVMADITYYYSAFPYTKNGVYNRDISNRISITPKRYTYFFGYDLDTADSDPDTRVSYPSDVDNANFTPAKIDSSTGIFNYGSWPSTPGDKFMPSPCMLNYDGTVAYYLDPNDYTKKEDGSASDVADTSFGGNAMMEWGKIYTKRWEDENGIYHFRCCDYQIEEDYECWCNYDKNNNQIDHFYTSIYLSSTVGNWSSDFVYRSISGLEVEELNSYAGYSDYIPRNGEDWTMGVLSDHLLIQDLLVMMAKSTDGQTAYGSGDNTRRNSGKSDTKGLFFGGTSGYGGPKIFGMELYWSYYPRQIAGWVLDEGVHKVKLTRGTHDGSTATDYNYYGGGYLTIDHDVYTADSVFYIKFMKTEAFGRIPILGTAYSTQYECDRMAYNISDYYVARVGRDESNNLASGPFYVKFNGGLSVFSLACKPSAN